MTYQNEVIGQRQKADQDARDHEHFLQSFLGPLTQPETGAGDQSATQRTRAEIEEMQAAVFWSRALRDPVGRRELYRLLAEAHAFSTITQLSLHTEHELFHALGEKAVAEHLMHMLARIDREAFFAMLDEHDPRYARHEKR